MLLVAFILHLELLVFLRLFLVTEKFVFPSLGC
jgi:hypothetical protein